MILEKLHRAINNFNKTFNWRRFRRDALHLGESLLVFGVLYGICLLYTSREWTEQDLRTVAEGAQAAFETVLLDELPQDTGWQDEGLQVSYSPVSYTHLDVYKRQGSGRSSPGRAAPLW